MPSARLEAAPFSATLVTLTAGLIASSRRCTIPAQPFPTTLEPIPAATELPNGIAGLVGEREGMCKVAGQHTRGRPTQRSRNGSAGVRVHC